MEDTLVAVGDALVAAEDALVAVGDALVAVEDTLVAVGDDTSAVEEGHTLDAADDDMLAVEEVANLLVVQTCQQWSWSANVGRQFGHVLIIRHVHPVHLVQKSLFTSMFSFAG